MKRTQIYLSAEQWRRLHVLSFQLHQSMSGLIRAALDRVYSRNKLPNFENAVNSAAGIWKNRKDLSNSAEYIRNLRKDSRMKRLRDA